MTDHIETFAVLAALVAGGRWLSAGGCAAHLGLFNAKSQVNRRGFLERVACRPSFPAPLVIGNEKKWRKSEVDRWAEDQRKISRSV
jgi:predicted DNA-binding transcriptional regulator AlpA